jgi:hypothetical protein
MDFKYAALFVIMGVLFIIGIAAGVDGSKPVADGMLVTM